MRKIIFVIIFYSLINTIFAGNDLKDSNFWEKIRENDKNRYPIIFVHGIVGKFEHWKETAKLVSGGHYFEMRYITKDKVFHNYFLGNPPYQTWNVSYYSENILEETFFGDLNKYAKRLEFIIEKIKLFSKKDKVIIISHSMGGIISRKYMINSNKNWDSVYKILTVGSPHLGTRDANLGVIGQVKDLAYKGKFIEELNEEWNRYNYKQKWGVAGAVTTIAWPDYETNPQATDNPMLNLVEINSAIPYGEWEDAAKNIDEAKYYTKNFSYRILVNDTHIGMLDNVGILRGILWTIQ